MPAYREYFDEISYINLSGRLTSKEMMGLLLEGSKTREFERIKIRVIDGLHIESVDFDESLLDSFVAIDKSSFFKNEDLVVISVCAEPQLRYFFLSYMQRMQLTPWTFHLVDSLHEAEEVCNTYGINFVHHLLKP